MVGDLLSELVLAGIALHGTWRDRRDRPGIALGMALIGVAALLGALEYAGMRHVDIAHRVATQAAASAAMPLLAASLRWRTARFALHAWQAWVFLLVGIMTGTVVAACTGLTIWNQLAPALAAMLIALTALQRRIARLVGGALVLITAFTLNLLTLTLAPLDSPQQLHLLLALALWMLTSSRQQPVQAITTAKPITTTKGTS